MPGPTSADPRFACSTSRACAGSGSPSSRRRWSEQGLDALVLLTSGNVLYATGVRSVLADNAPHLPAAASARRRRRRRSPRLHPLPRRRAARAPRRPPPPTLWPETDAGVEDMGRRARGPARRPGRPPARARRLHRADVVRAPDAARAGSSSSTAPACSPGRLHKTPDELECMRRSWADQRSRHVRGRAGRCGPGIRLTDLTAVYFRRLVRARADVQLPRPGVAGDARAHRRRAVEHERRRAVQPRHQRPHRDATATSCGPTPSRATRATRPTSGARGSSGGRAARSRDLFARWKDDHRRGHRPRSGPA